MVVFFILSPTSSHLHPLQVENCCSNSRLVEDEGDNGKFRTERVNSHVYLDPLSAKDNYDCFICFISMLNQSLRMKIVFYHQDLQIDKYE